MRFHTPVAATAALTLAALSLAQPPAPVPTAPAPAPAARQPGAVELSNVPKDDAEARKLLADSVAALNKVGPISFKARYASAGAAMQIDGKADIVLVRNNGVPTESTFRAVGRLQMPALDKPEFFVSRYVDDKGGRRIAWQDNAAKAVFDRPEGPAPDGKETEGGRQAGLVLRSMLMPALVSPTPFSDELKEGRAGADVIKAPIVFLPDEAIGGEPCKVIKVIFKLKEAERTIWIGAKDKLPRKYEQYRNGLSRYWEITDLSTLDQAKGAEVVRIAIPDGYRSDVSNEGGARPVVQPPLPTGPQSVATAMGGPAVGQLAPDFDLKTAEGKSVTLASLKGQPVIVTFGGSVFPQSWPNQAAAAGALAGKAKVVAVACRESDPARAAKAFADAKGVGQLLLQGEATAALYNVRGYPSTVVIGPDGKVMAFFEGTVTEADLTGALSGVAASPAK